ncbi:MAG: O-antigen ligase family protein [Saprospiraceae bacterium]
MAQLLDKAVSFFSTSEAHPQRWQLAAITAATVVCLPVGIWKNLPFVAAIPAVMLLAWLTLVDFRKVFFLMLAAIPVSIEVSIGSFGTDLPSEPLIWVLYLSAIAWFLKSGRRAVDVRFVRHQLTLLLFLHLSWMLFTAAISQDAVVSVKFVIAKTWYVVVFYFLAGRLLDSEQNLRNLVWAFFLPLLGTVLWVLVRHAPTGFEFDTVNFVMGPFYRNHVMYACVQAIFLPFLWYATYWYRRWSWRWWVLVLGIVTLLVGINFAYTRAAYVALVAAVVIYWCIRARLMKMVLVAAVLVLTLIIGWVTSRDNYLLFAPDFQRAVTHKEFDNLLEATTKLEDISVMERVYRWVAAAYMIQDRPLAGFGPGCFYFFYTDYTVTSFQTYVSDNPERSGIHCYYLMTAVEQGLPGAAIFLLFCAAVMLYGERVYHQTTELWRRRMLVAALLSFMLICLLMFMNDFVETDKIGSFFFMAVAILVNTDLQNKSKASF